MMLTSEKTATITTYTNAYDTHGRASKTASTSQTIRCSIQPLNGRELQQLTDNQRTKETLKIYTQETITADTGDKATIDSVEYTILTVEDWKRTALSPKHNKIIVIKDKNEH